MAPTSGESPRGGTARFAMIAVVVALAAFVVAGCRRPDPVYDRFPQPLSMRDVARTEFRTEVDLDEAERIVVEALLDRHQSSYAELRSGDLAALLVRLRDEPEVEDEQELRRRVAAHRSIVERIAGLDAEFLAGLEQTLGAHRQSFIEALRARRTLDRANAVIIGDGGLTLPDLREILRPLDLSAESLARIEPELATHEARAASIATSVAAAQMRLPLEYREVLRRRGPPEADVDPGLKDDVRRKAVGAAEQRRFAEARRDLEVELRRFADLIDSTVEVLAESMPPDEAAALRRVILRTRLDDGSSRSADRAAFDALIASRLTALPAATRSKIASMREQFMRDDEEAMRAWLELWKSSKVPGELEPGGVAATKERNQARGALEKKRAVAVTKFREEVMRLVPAELHASFETMPKLAPEDFSRTLAEMVDRSSIAPIVSRRPRGYAEPKDEPPVRESREDAGPGEFRLLLPAPPDHRDLTRLAERGGVQGSALIVLGDVSSVWRERWDVALQAARDSVQPIGEQMIGAVQRRAFDDAERGMRRFLAAIESIRQERMLLDAELAEDIEVAVPDMSREALILWKWERSAIARHLRWDDLPAHEVLQLPPQATINLFDIIADADLPPESAPLVVGALEPLQEDLDQQIEQMRQTALTAVQKLVLEVIVAQIGGVSEDQALSTNRPEVRRAIGPVRDAGTRLAGLQSDAIAACCAALPPGQSRRLREAFAEAVFPRALDEGWRASRAMEGILGDRSLDAGQAAAMERIAEERERRRDEALDVLFAWGLERGSEAAAVARRNATRRQVPELLAVLFTRQEADARALRAAWGTLDTGQRQRHRDVAAWFQEEPAKFRLYD